MIVAKMVKSCLLFAISDISVSVTLLKSVAVKKVINNQIKSNLQVEQKVKRA